MKRLLTMVCLAIWPFSLFYAQDSRADSLLNMTSVQADDELARTYYELSLALQTVYTDSALYFANRAETMLQRGDPDNLLAYVYKSKGKIYALKLVTERSIFYYRKAYDEFIKLENYDEIGDCALRIGNLYYDVANFGEAYYFFLQSLTSSERHSDRLSMARAEINLGNVSSEMGRLSDAEKHYQNAYTIYNELGLADDECGALNNIGGILYDKAQYDSALTYFFQVMEKLDPDSLSSAVQLNILSGVYNNTALAYTELGEQVLALDYFKRGLGLALKADDEYNVSSVYINLGSLFGEMGKLDSALFYLHRALQIADNRGFRSVTLDTFEELAKLHAGIGSYAPAYNWQVRYDTLYKSMFNERQSDQISKLRAMYEQEISEKEIS
ncbi:MAG: tetratricopeptide repeat protein, partial [Bacteroidales bacterium]|nr:tetratricopeptide repeat protein [Bacteroidales bacterium]